MTSAKFLGFLTPSPPCQHFGLIYSTKITQPPLLHQYLGNPPPSPSPLTSFVNGPLLCVRVTISSFLYRLCNGIEMSMCCLKSLNKRNEWQMTSHPPAHPHNNLPTVCPQWGSYDASLGSTSNSSTLSQQRPHSTTSPQLAHYEGIISIVVKAQGIQINILSTKSPLNNLPTIYPL